MKTVALLTESFWPFAMGGMQKHSYYMVKYLARIGINVTVFHNIPENSKNIRIEDFFSQQELSIINFFEVPWTKHFFSFPGHYLYKNYIFSKQIYQIIRENFSKYDFIYAQGFTAWYLLNKTKQNSLPPVAVNFHGLNMFQKAPSFVDKIQYWIFGYFVKNILRKSNFSISLGGKLDYIIRKYYNNVITIPVGIEKEWIINNIKYSNDKIRFVFIGRYEKLKGIEELTKVLKTLNGDFHFDFIGPIPVQKRIKDTRIQYHGQINDEETIKTILINSDILVCPSWSEGMPTVILEAMASGCAIIATDVGAVSEQVDAKNGILIKPGNVKELSDSLIQMLNIDRGELFAMKKESIEKIREKFLWEHVIEKTVNKLNIK